MFEARNYDFLAFGRGKIWNYGKKSLILRLETEAPYGQ